MAADQDWSFLKRVLQPSLEGHGCGFILNLQPGRLSGLEDFAPGLFFGQVEPDLLQPAHNACRAMCAARMLSTVPPYDQNNISYLNKNKFSRHAGPSAVELDGEVLARVGQDLHIFGTEVVRKSVDHLSLTFQ